MHQIGLFEAVKDEVGEIIVAEVATGTVRELAAADSKARERLIVKGT
jgi:hypothetical protein